MNNMSLLEAFCDNCVGDVTVFQFTQAKKKKKDQYKYFLET